MVLVWHDLRIKSNQRLFHPFCNVLPLNTDVCGTCTYIFWTPIQKSPFPLILKSHLKTWSKKKIPTFNYRHSSFENQKLSMKSPIDFNSVLDTINYYWIDPGKYFFPNTSSLRAIYDSFKSKILKVVESKNIHHFN